MIAFGLVGAVVSGLIVDRTKAFTPVTKISFTFAVLFGIVMTVVSHETSSITHLCFTPPPQSLFLFFSCNVHDPVKGTRCLGADELVYKNRVIVTVCYQMHNMVRKMF